MKNAAGILLVIYLFFLVPLLAGAFIDAAAGVKRRNISSTYANGFVAMLGIFWGVAVLFLYRGCTLEKLSMVWMLATITICVASILANKKAIYGMYISFLDKIYIRLIEEKKKILIQRINPLHK